MRITGIAAAAIALGVLCGCHNGGVNQNTAQLRGLNAVVDAEPLDVLVDDGVKASAVALNATSAYTEISSGTRDVKVRSSTTQTVLSDKSTAFAEGTNNTLLMYGRRAALQTLVLADDTTAISTGNFRVRVVNLAPDTGVDLYLATGDISSLPTTIASAGYGVITGSADVAPGTWQVTITAAGTRDVLLQSTAQSFTAGNHYTVAVVPSPGGKLVNAILLMQGGDATLLQNSTARLKATNAIADAAAVNFRADGTALLLNVPFAASSSYVTIAQGSHALQLELSNVPGAVATSLTRTLDPARDYSVIAAGTSAAPQLVAFSDDNSLPAAGFAKVRFANVMAGSAAADVQVNFASLVGGLAFGTASAYYSVAPGTTYTLTFASNGGLTVLATLSPAELDAGGVYTAYLLGAPGAGQVRLVRDR
jgi:hypothetical protein